MRRFLFVVYCKAIVQLGLPSIVWNHRMSQSRVWWNSGTRWRLCLSLVELRSAIRCVHSQMWRLMGFCHFVLAEHLALYVRPSHCQALQQRNKVRACSSRAYKINFCKGTRGVSPGWKMQKNLSLYLLCLSFVWLLHYALKKYTHAQLIFWK